MGTRRELFSSAFSNQFPKRTVREKKERTIRTPRKAQKKSRRMFCFQKKSGRDVDVRYEEGVSFLASRSFFSANFFSNWSFSLVSSGVGSAASCGSSLDVNHSGNFSCRPM